MSEIDNHDNPDWTPLEEEEDRRQRDGLLEWLEDAGFDATNPATILDLGCGAGRVMVPLVEAGHRVVGVDRDPEAVERVRAALPEVAEWKAFEYDFVNGDDELPAPFGKYDAVVCLGHTWMLLAEINQAVATAQRLAASLKPHGLFILDDIPGELWPSVMYGAWVTGVSEDESSQFVWAHDDAVFTLRAGPDVDPDRDTLEPGDTRFRLWTRGALELLARLTGFAPPIAHPDVALMVLRRAE
ncbi:MAG: class I SAM-dependent methyltransferase [Phycisphaerales bacterium]